MVASSQADVVKGGRAGLTQASRRLVSQDKVSRERFHDEIYERIYIAILEHRLAPGTKLGEEQLARIFEVSRARVREVLSRLSHEQVVQLFPQRGAFVAKPSPEEAMDVFETRRLLEPAVVGRLIDHLTKDKVARLRQHLELELDARRREDRRAVVRLSGEFHVLLATLCGNSAYHRMMRELTTLTCLIIFLYDAPTAMSCRADEHAEIVDAIARRDLGMACQLMTEHLNHIESSLILDSLDQEIDLAAVLGDSR
nr:GntR family transcriptional regulator [Orrella marina]